MKRCTKCKKEGPLSDFAPDLRSKDGLTFRCRACIRAYARQQYKKERAVPATPLTCTTCKATKDPEEFYADARKASGRQSQCSDCQKKSLRAGYAKHPLRRLVLGAKARAKRSGLPFALSESDLEVPDCCPVLGLKLRASSGPRQHSSISLDRIVPEKGYVPGNVAVISWRANDLKGDGSLDELELLVAWMKRTQRS